MQVVDPGHLYKVQNIDGKGTQTIQFVKRRGYDAELLPEKERKEGIQGQELLRVLIDRTLYLNAENVSHENVEIVDNLRKALVLYETRAARRHIERLSMIERHDPCLLCGHITCFCDERSS